MRRDPTIQTKRSLAEGPPLSGAMEDCSIVRVQQLQNALSPKVLYVRVTTHVRFAVERSRHSRASATIKTVVVGEMPDSDR